MPNHTQSFENIYEAVLEAYTEQKKKVFPSVNKFTYGKNKAYQCTFLKVADWCQKENINPHFFVEERMGGLTPEENKKYYPQYLMAKGFQESVKKSGEEKVLSLEESFEIYKARLIAYCANPKETPETILSNDVYDFPAWFRVVTLKEMPNLICSKYLLKAKRYKTNELINMLKDKCPNTFYRLL